MNITNYNKGGNHSSSNSMNINAVSGAILKNHPKSWFERFNLHSERAKELLTEGGHQGKKTVWYDNSSLKSGGVNVKEDDPDKSITVLQMVICGDMEVIAELVYSKDYNHE